MDIVESNTDELVRRAGHGDASATHELLDRYRGRLAQMVETRLDPRVRGRIDPSDVVQETLVAASQKLAQYAAEKPLPFYPWLRQIAWEKLVHQYDLHLRAAKRSVSRERTFRPDVSDESVLELAHVFVGRASSPSAAMARQELQVTVRRALAAISDQDRELLMLRYLEQLPSKDIAAIMEISEGAVNVRHMRALERMRKLLSGSELED